MPAPPTEFGFTRVFDGQSLAGNALAKTLYGRCDDALVTSRDGTPRIGFDRRAASLREAVRSALADVAFVLPAAELRGIVRDTGDLAALVE